MNRGEWLFLYMDRGKDTGVPGWHQRSEIVSVGGKKNPKKCCHSSMSKRMVGSMSEM